MAAFACQAFEVDRVLLEIGNTIRSLAAHCFSIADWYQYACNIIDDARVSQAPTNRPQRTTLWKCLLEATKANGTADKCVCDPLFVVWSNNNICSDAMAYYTRALLHRLHRPTHHRADRVLHQKRLPSVRISQLGGGKCGAYAMPRCQLIHERLRHDTLESEPSETRNTNISHHISANLFFIVFLNVFPFSIFPSFAFRSFARNTCEHARRMNPTVSVALPLPGYELMGYDLAQRTIYTTLSRPLHVMLLLHHCRHRHINKTECRQLNRHLKQRVPPSPSATYHPWIESVTLRASRDFIQFNCVHRRKRTNLFRFPQKSSSTRCCLIFCTYFHPLKKANRQNKLQLHQSLCDHLEIDTKVAP